MIERAYSDAILKIIAEEAQSCDRKALEAFLNHKESITEYWVCTENRFQALYDKVAKIVGRDDRLRSGPFKIELQGLRDKIRNKQFQQQAEDIDNE